MTEALFFPPPAIGPADPAPLSPLATSSETSALSTTGERAPAENEVSRKCLSCGSPYSTKIDAEPCFTRQGYRRHHNWTMPPTEDQSGAHGSLVRNATRQATRAMAGLAYAAALDDMRRMLEDERYSLMPTREVFLRLMAQLPERCDEIAEAGGGL